MISSGCIDYMLTNCSFGLECCSKVITTKYVTDLVGIDLKSVSIILLRVFLIQ